jgi:hypothetical protein
MAEEIKQWLMPKRGTHLRERRVSVHREVAKVATDLCLETYERAMHDNGVWERWKKMHPGASRTGLYRLFVQAYLPGCIEEARRRLAMQLSDETLPKAVRDHIAEVLVEDAGLFQGRIPLGRLVNDAEEADATAAAALAQANN